MHPACNTTAASHLPTSVRRAHPVVTMPVVATSPFCPGRAILLHSLLQHLSHHLAHHIAHGILPVHCGRRFGATIRRRRRGRARLAECRRGQYGQRGCNYSGFACERHRNLHRYELVAERGLHPSQTGCSPHGSWAVGTAAQKSARSRQRKRLAHVAIDAKLHQEEKMADDKSKRDFRDRDRVSAEDEREVEYFAQQNGITADQVRRLIKSFGNDRGRLTEAAKALRGISPAGADEVTREARQQTTPMHLDKE
ncbi:DUF3606 domain-containing protein [Mesorhizobium sp. M0220]|uniref:DUF3606 domain-containing protein n=1 Tax=unclassified Mesorhizobium TaxID=325217 RepID=UPI00333BE2D7